MGGLGPGIGGSELIVIGLVALLVVGPKDLPLLMRRVGQAVAKARGMANEFRASFDEMARQSELDDLRKEVDALRRGQGMHPLGDEAAAAFKDINQSLNAPITTPALPAPNGATPSEPSTMTASEWPDTAAEMVAAKEPTKTTPKPKPAANAAPTADVAPVRKTTAKVAARKAVATPAPAPEPAKPAKVAKPRAKAATAKAAKPKATATPRKRTPKS
ncbi:MAG: twin-arginine translocase subunit TatB [Brevundimonas sp.]|nr:MAG: twin-arginine translocase subunit TatB [Brevundimonas sp.]